MLVDSELASLSALSGVLDLANGLQGEKSLLTGLFALELAQAAGLDDATARAAFFTGLLRHLGCTGFAARESKLGNDQQLRRELLHGTQTPLDVARTITRAGGALGLARLITAGPSLKNEWFAEACGAARVLAQGLGLDETVLTGLDEVFERWDAKGGPHAKGGTSLSAAGRVANVAHVAVLFLLSGGLTAAEEALAAQSGSVIDPSLVKTARSLLPTLGNINANRIARAEAVLHRQPLPLDVQTLAAVFGDFADLQIPHTRGHSRRVATVADEAAQRLGLDAASREHLRTAAHLHDLGHATLPASFWLEPRWSSSDTLTSHAHAGATERLLAAAPLLVSAAPIAGAHHERLDGSGYARSLNAAALNRASRLLAVADVWVAMQEPRPHRAALSESQAKTALQAEAKAGRLDADCVAMVTGTESRRGTGDSAALTPREREVLQALARGLTNKEIANALGLSARTVQHHTIHIYEKLGVSTRAGASLIAARSGLV